MDEQRTRGELLLIDANSIIHRAYHALPPLTGPGGSPTGALYGLASILIKLLKDGAPRYVAAAFDRPEPTFREQKFREYKALRPPTPTDLISQLQESKNLIAHFGIKILESPGYEADDIISTLVEKFSDQVDQTTILSGDLDTLQSVRGKRIVAEVPRRGISETIVYDEQGVEGRFGVAPNLIPDYKGLVGDKSDNIPGVSGIGPKTAASLIKKYGPIEQIYRRVDSIKRGSPGLAAKLEQGREMAFLSKELATTSRDAPCPAALGELKTELDLGGVQLRRYLENLGFKTLLQRLESGSGARSQRVGKLF
jgi:DNA polymerase-1